MAHWLGAMQSVFDWQGNVHFPYTKLQWCVPQGTSFSHERAIGPGMASGAESA